MVELEAVDSLADGAVATLFLAVVSLFSLESSNLLPICNHSIKFWNVEFEFPTVPICLFGLRQKLHIVVWILDNDELIDLIWF